MPQDAATPIRKITPAMGPYEILRAPMRAWYSRMLSHAPYVPCPRTTPFAGSPDPAAGRVLLVGNGPAHGWGVVTHGLSLVGHLAADLAERTGRAVGVEFVGDERMTARSAEEWLGDRAADGRDLVIVAIGLNDALRLTPVDAFTADYRRLVQRIRTDLGDAARIVLVPLPHVRAYAMASGLLGAVAQHHADRLSAVVRGTAAGLSGVHVVEAPVERFEPTAPLGSSDLYRDLADQLGREVAPLLEQARRERGAAADAAARAACAPPDLTVDEQLDRLLAETKERLGVAIAAVNLVDGDRVWNAAQAGAHPVQAPRSLSFCGVVADTGAELVVPDRSQDERFADNALLEVADLPFYAGVPLRAGGEVLGSLCVLDVSPRSADSVSVAELERVAREVEARLAARAAAVAADPATAS